jgi:HopA1 effector protein family
MKTKHDGNRAIKNVLAAIKVKSPHEFTFAGRNFTVQGAHHQPVAPATPNAQSQAFIKTLSAYLYEFAYSRPFRAELSEPEARDLSPDLKLIEALSAANKTQERWEHGWTIAQILPHGQIMAQKGGVERSLWPGTYLSKDGPAAMTRAGAEISIFYQKESRSLQTGFYYAFGETPEDESHGFGLVRLYWNISFEGAPRLISMITSRMNRFHVPFRLKCATSRSQYDRTDVAVVYLAKRFFRITADLMLDVHSEVEDFLGEPVPLFSKRLAKGLSVAEDTGSGESFGQSRCQRLAESVWNCYLRGEQLLNARWNEFRRLLEKSSIDPQHLHLNAGSMDWYELPPEIA